MWGQTRKVTILGGLPDRLEIVDDKDRKAAISALIEKRKADQRFTVEVKHIGSPEDPLRFDSLLAEEETRRHAARVRARKSVEAEGLPTTDEHLGAALGRDPQWSKDLGESCKAWIVEGLVNGAEEYKRIWALGQQAYGAGGGGGLLIDAATEVKRYQQLTEDEGKG